MSTAPQNHFLTTPGDVLDVIFSQCEVKDLIRLMFVCKQFLSRMERDQNWKEGCIKLWRSIISKPDLVWIVDSVKTLQWKTIVKFLSNNSNRGEYRYVWDTDHEELHLSRYGPHGFIPEESFLINAKFESITFGTCLEKGNGTGTRIWTGGSRYTGQWKDWSRDGFGECVYSTGDAIYVGQWRNGDRSGRGKMIWPEGYQYEGEWDRDVILDGENCIHPRIIKCLEERRCTKEDSVKRFLPQMAFSCNQCYKTVCITCYENGCHHCNNYAKLKKKWCDISECSCQKEECKRRRID
eukprot:TRINITY_DN5391_c0_g1_i1.p1 TRINITY_DN5391_c0_g1~~TRINITY_DN5391_c0_g1_i1.p1  ORF type:complete len:295 (+),score=44.26 TRINITY_DN5391_c0_g1_i1:16-900(+)